MQSVFDSLIVHLLTYNTFLADMCQTSLRMIQNSFGAQHVYDATPRNQYITTHPRIVDGIAVITDHENVIIILYSAIFTHRLFLPKPEI